MRKLKYLIGFKIDVFTKKMVNATGHPKMREIPWTMARVNGIGDSFDLRPLGKSRWLLYIRTNPKMAFEVYSKGKNTTKLQS